MWGQDGVGGEGGMRCLWCSSSDVAIGSEVLLAVGLEWNCRQCGMMMRYRKEHLGGKWVRDWGRNKYWVGPGVLDWVECPDGVLCILKEVAG
jgi:hypothetical protein